MNTSSQIRFAVVGCGHIGKRHAHLISGHPDCELVALCDVRPRAELHLELSEQIPWYNDLESLLANEPTVEVVCICTPNGLHAPQALTVLQHRRHVVLEKPMALRRADCEAIIHRALNVGRQVFCVMQNRYSPAAAWLKKVMLAHQLGEIYQVQINCFWNRDDRYYLLPDGRPHPWHGDAELDGGVLFTQFAHFIDLLYWIFGDITDISGRFANFAHADCHPFPDSGTVQFRLVRGGLGSLSFTTAVYDRNFQSSLSVIGSQGSVRLGGQYMNELTHCHIAGVPMPVLPAAVAANNYGPYQGSAANHHFVIQNVVDVLQGKEEATTNALEGMKVVEMKERVLRGED